MLLWPASAKAQLTAADVQTVINQAVTRALQISPNSVIAVTDREGNVLGVWNVRGGEPTADEISSCVSKAGTAAYLSSNQNAFTSRTAGFIIQQHFPPGVRTLRPARWSASAFRICFSPTSTSSGNPAASSASAARPV